MQLNRDPEMPILSPMASRGRGRGTPSRVAMEQQDVGPSPYQQEVMASIGTGLVNAGTPSVTSQVSSGTRKRQAEMDGRKRIREIRNKYQQQIKSKQEEIEVLLRRIVEAETKLFNLTERDPEKMTGQDYQIWRECNGEMKTCNELIVWNRDAIARQEADMKFEIDMIKEEVGDEMEMIDLEDEEEQFLDPMDQLQSSKNKVRDWNIKNEVRVGAVQGNEFLEQTERRLWNKSPPPPTPQPSQEEGIVKAFAEALGKTFGSLNTNQRVVTKQVDKDLPIFGGKPEEWLLFKSEFERTNTSYQYTESEKIVRLRKYLKGTAKEAVLHLLPNPFNVDRIMEILEERFGKPKHVLNAMIERVKTVPNPDINKPETIIKFGTEVDSLVTNILAYKKTDYLNNVQLLKDLVDKLPPIMSSDWYRNVLDGVTLQEDLISFQKWIWKEVRIASERYTPEIKDDESEERNTRKRSAAGNIHTASSDGGSRSCAVCCKGNHATASCYEFKRKSCDERWKIVKEKKLCFCCLSPQHYTTNCPVLKTCGKENCNMQHHEFLHYEKRRERTIPVPLAAENPRNQQEPDEGGNPIGTITAAVKVSSANLPMIPVVIRGDKCSRVVYALLDSGASVSMIEESIAKEVGLTGIKKPFRFTVFENQVKEERNSEAVKFDVGGHFPGARLYEMKNVHTVRKLGIPGINVDLDILKLQHPHLKRMQARGIRKGVPSMIIGYDHFELFSPRMYLENEANNSPSAYRGKLGWYVREKQKGENSFFGLVKLNEENDDYLHEAMKNFFSTENFGVKVVDESHRSIEDKKALSILEKTTVKNQERWETGLLWRDENCELPDSFPTALKRLKTMEREMDSDAEFAEFCMKRFDDYKKKGYLVPKQSTCDEKKRWYLPWFFAYHPTKKPRLVFDGAAKCQAGKCLNDFLLKGPDLLRPLPDVLARFRIHQVGITADIAEMFHQVSLKMEDRPSQTVLYRGMDRDCEPTELEMSVLFFGSASSPSSAIYAKDKNADEFGKKYPETVTAIHRDFYMDDLLGGSETAENAIILRKQLSEIHDEGGFKLTKWSSNSEEVVQSIPVDLRAPDQVKVSEKADYPVEKTLGLYWNPKKDEFLFNLNFEKIPDDLKSGRIWPTKRTLASITMSLFDPLGFVYPFKIKALMIMQDLWRAKIGWDDEIPADVLDKWKTWICDLEKVKDIRIPRRLTTTSVYEASSIQLHVFCDASKDAFASVAYLRIETGGSVVTPFIFGKSKVAPLKELTIPRLELQAGVLGTRICKTVKKMFGELISIHETILWTDSMTVLRWIRSVNGRFKEFVSNRIGEIMDATETGDWRWIPTALNVADDATRFSKSSDLSSNSRWLTGPSFLLMPRDKWPKEDVNAVENLEDDTEIRNVISAAFVDGSEIGSSIDEGCGLESDKTLGRKLYLPEIENYSNWMRLLKATAARYLAIRKFRKAEPGHTTLEDMEKALKLWIIRVQKDCFPDDLRSLAKAENMLKGTRLGRLSPALDEDGIIILRGRIENAMTSESVKRPPILDPMHPFTQLMINWYHASSGHFGQERVLHELRQKVWILNARNAIKKECAKCMLCRNKKATPLPPEMGQLPLARLESGRPPFFHTGVDYFGPFHTKQGRSIVKRWGVLFSCMATRAIHLELAETLDTSDMINSLVRFINIRGKPCHIWSDNGTNFIGAEREIRENLAAWNQLEIGNSLIVRGIEWHFIPPASPHMGGGWERMVGCVKRILYALLKEQNPKDVVLRTLFAEVVGILNSRPITYASVDPNDNECLTPNHLLNIHCVDGPTIPGDFIPSDKFRKSWRYCQDLAQNFWKRWSKEYLPWLVQREKWYVKQKPISVGDIVIVLEDNAPRNQWKKGVVLDVHPGKDKQVRAVTVKIAHVDPADKKKLVKFSVLKRPAVKVCKIGESGEN